MEYVKDKYIFKPSTRKGKKYDAYDKKTKKYIVSFGGAGYQQYKDKIGHYSKDNHLDKKRKENYYKRHGKEAVKESAKWFSHSYLW